MKVTYKKGQKAQHLIDYLAVLKQYRQQFEPFWYINYYAYNGNKNVSWDRALNTISFSTPRKRSFLSIPEVKKQADSFENLMLSFEPIFTFFPDDWANQDQIQRAQMISKRIHKEYTDWAATDLLHQFVHKAIIYPISFYGFNITEFTNLNGARKRKISPVILDAFDVYFDPRFEFEDNQIIFQVIRTNETAIKNNADYDIQPDEESFDPSLDWKELINSELYGSQRPTGKMKPVTLYKVCVKDENGLWVVIMTITGLVLKADYYEGSLFFPMVPLKFHSGDVYQPSYVQNMIPLARTLERVANRIQEWMDNFAIGVILARNGSEISISNNGARVVRYDGEAPIPMQMPAFQPAIIQWFNTLISLCERYGINAVAAGIQVQASNIRSADQQEQMVNNQVNQEKTAFDNLQFAFKRIAQLTLYYLSEITTEPESATFSDPGQQFSGATFVGQKYSALYANTGAIPIPPIAQDLNVTIEDATNYSIEKRRHDLLELATEWANIQPMFQKPLLELYQVGNIGDLLAQMETDKSLFSNYDFQLLMQNADSMTPQDHQVLANFLKLAAQYLPDMQAQAGGPNAGGAAVPTSANPVMPPGTGGGGNGAQPPTQGPPPAQ